MKPNLAIIFLIISVIMFSCKNKSAEIADAESESGFIEITKEQFKTEMMEFGKPTISEFADLINFTGTIVPSVNGHAEISLPFQGLVVHIHCTPGQLVRKSEVLFEISGVELIDMQKDYAESAAHLIRLKSEFERQKELNDENIGTKKDFIIAESLYHAEKAKFNALKIKIEILGLDASKIEGGEFYNSFAVKAPIKGFITNINTNIGQYVEPQQTIAEIVDTGSFQLSISVFEKNINKLKVGQNVEYYVAGDRNQKNTAKIKVIGKTINKSTKSIDCFAEIKDLDKISLVNNQFVEGKVIVDSDSVMSVPETAILKSENETYILTFEKETDELYYLRKLKVTTGRKNSGYIEIEDLQDSKMILLKGGYNITI